MFNFLWLCLFPHASTALVGQGVLCEVPRSHSDTPHSVGLLWASDEPIAETYTWQHTTLTRERHQCPRRDSNLQSQKANGRSPSPQSARPMESAVVMSRNVKFRIKVDCECTCKLYTKYCIKVDCECTCKLYTKYCIKVDCECTCKLYTKYCLLTELGENLT